MFRVWTAGVAVLAFVALPGCGDPSDVADASQVDDARHDCERRRLDGGALTVEDGQDCAGMDLRQLSVGATDALRFEITVDNDRADPPVAWGVEGVVHVFARDDEPSRRLVVRCDEERLDAGVVVGNGPLQPLEFGDSEQPGCRRERAKILLTLAFETLDLDGVPAAGREVEISVTTVSRPPERAYPRLVDRLDQAVRVQIPTDVEEADTSPTVPSWPW